MQGSLVFPETPKAPRKLQIRMSVPGFCVANKSLNRKFDFVFLTLAGDSLSKFCGLWKILPCRQAWGMCPPRRDEYLTVSSGGKYEGIPRILNFTGLVGT